MSQEAEYKKRFFGVVALSVVMSLLAILNRSQMYVLVWALIGYWAYNGRASEIVSWLKVFLIINAGGWIGIVLFADDATVQLIGRGTKDVVLVSVAIAFAIKLALFFYMKSQQTQGKIDSSKETPHFPTSTPDERYWAAALAELDSAKRRAGLWARVFSEAQGDDALAKANYLKARAAELRDEQIVPTLETHFHCLKCGKLNLKGAKECKHCHATIPAGP